jgi:hypothetical protein
VTALADAAVAYASRGRRVFPCWPRTKAPAGTVAPHGVLDATTDPERIRAWWVATPNANVAIATGRVSDFVVLDVDPRNGGEESLEEVESRYGRLPETPVALTGGGGSHTLFRHPGGVMPNRVALGGYAGIDLKGDGGYIIAPPSIHPNGRGYAWNVLLHPADVPMAPCPKWLLELAMQGPSPRRVAYATGDFAGVIPTRIRHLLQSDARIRARFRREPGDHPDQSPSGVDASLAHLLARRGLGGAEIEATLRASRAQAGLPERRGTYFAATVGKALGGTHA